MKLSTRLDLLEVNATQEAAPKPCAAKRCEREPKVSTENVDTNVSSILDELEGELKKEMKSERGSKLLGLLMKTAKAVLAPTSIPEYWELDPVSEMAKETRSAPPTAMRSQLYANVASKGVKVWSKPTIRELEAPMKTEDKESLV